MIVYQSTKRGFINDVLSKKSIEDIIRSFVREKLDMEVSRSEYESWRNSIGDAMYKVMNINDISEDSGVAIEYSIPRTRKRIDFLISGYGSENEKKVVIIELKQWTDVEITDKDGVVLTYYKQGKSEEPHPSYKAWSYAMLLKGFNTAIYENNINLNPCCYLHNFRDYEVIRHPFYADLIEKAPVFCKGDAEELQKFIIERIKYGDSGELINEIENGKIRPSKELADNLASMLKGNPEFVLIDDQKLVYENALSLAKKSNDQKKNVLIVQGGPGTGKSVVAINLLSKATSLGLNTRYVTKNAAPRAVFEAKLTGTFRKTEISNLLTGSSVYYNCDENSYDFIIVDEAHRLNKKGGIFNNLGENQIKEIIQAAKCSVFFIDEDQRVTWKDIGKTEEIVYWADNLGADIQIMKLESQFRCNGSDGYISWLSNTLQIRETANVKFDIDNYDFKIFDDPNQLREEIIKKNGNNKSRLVAGYCWNWVSKKNPQLYDIVIPEYNFQMKWNLDTDGSLYLISPNSVNEIGCIHTCQGLELEYVGVIIGPDLIVRDGKVLTIPKNRAKTDKSLSGYQRDYKEDKEFAEQKADSIIKNTYKTLMTRGLKGCYIYCTDKETRDYFKDRLLF